MIALSKLKEAERLLALGTYSQRKVAALAGLSRATVKSIASGARPDYEARMEARLAANEPLGPLARCSSCGGMVHMPCRLCALERFCRERRELARASRRRAREHALRQLLAAVRRANWQRDAVDPDRPAPGYLPAAAVSEPSDCK